MELQKIPDQSVFVGNENFNHGQRVAKMLASSSLIPKDYQGNIQNTMIALEIANRIGASPLMVMQNLYIVHGKPSWSSSFIIAAINSSKKFSPLRFEITGEGLDKGCVAWALENGTNERLESPKVTMAMAKAEGWSTKTGSKWVTMPDLMLRYRAASFFGRLYAPQILMGMHTVEEIVDIKAEPIKLDKEAERIELMINDAETIEDLITIEAHVGEAQLELFEAKKEALKK